MAPLTHDVKGFRCFVLRVALTRWWRRWWMSRRVAWLDIECVALIDGRHGDSLLELCASIPAQAACSLLATSVAGVVRRIVVEALTRRV